MHGHMNVEVVENVCQKQGLELLCKEIAEVRIML